MTLTLSEMTDSEIEAAVARYVEGYTDMRPQVKRPARIYGLHPGHRYRTRVPFYLSDSSVVMSLLGKIRPGTNGEPYYFAIKSPLLAPQGWVIEQWWAHHDGDILEWSVENPSFCKCACYALLRSVPGLCKGER